MSTCRLWLTETRIGWGLALGLAITLVLGLVACRGKPQTPAIALSFETLCGLSREEFARANAQAIEQWIDKRYGGVAEVLTSVIDDSEVVTYQWQTDESIGSAFLRDNRLVRIAFRVVNAEHKFGSVVDAFGNPDMVYRNFEVHERVLYALDLEYLADGLAVGTEALVPISDVQRPTGLAVQLDTEMDVDYVTCFLPTDSVFSLVDDVLLTPKDGVDTQVKRRVPWPGFGAWVSLRDSP